MKILIINCGSSSIKYKLFEMPSEITICEGIVERISTDEAILKYESEKVKTEEKRPIPTHKSGLEKIAATLLHPEKGVVQNAMEIDVVGHRVVHGGKDFASTTLVNEAVKKKIKEYSVLAPLHNPHNLEGILLAEEFFPHAKQVAVFDTAFHSSIPVKAKKYAIPNTLYSENNIQAYGFHGTSHKFVSEKAIIHLGISNSKIITIHLGNGCSITAVHNGKSIDHSMGFGPSNGLIMGSRSGDIDHSIIFHLVDTLGYNLEKVRQMLIKESGMLGLTGYSDLRDIQKAALQGNEECQLALEMNTYRIKKFIGAYAAAMKGLDAVVFTAGVGENSDMVRKLVCNDMNFLGIELDEAKNKMESTSIREINSTSSKVKILVIPTDEELEIAKQAFELISQ